MNAERRPFGKFLERFSKEGKKLTEKAPAVPVFELSRQINDHILVNKEDQAHLMAQVTERIHDQLNPVAAALDAMYKDNLHLSENLLMKDKKGNIQFILGDLDADGELTIVSMKGHKIKTPDGKTEPGCQSAVFSKTTPDNLAYFQENFIEIKKDRKENISFQNLPEDNEQGTVGILLDDKDKITNVAYFGSLEFLPDMSIQPPYGIFSEESIWQYKINDNSFSAKAGYLQRAIIGCPITTYNFDYIPNQKGSFIRKVGKDIVTGEMKQLTISIEQEIQHIIQKLPLEK